MCVRACLLACVRVFVCTCVCVCVCVCVCDLLPQNQSELPLWVFLDVNMFGNLSVCRFKWYINEGCRPKKCRRYSRLKLMTVQAAILRKKMALNVFV